MEFSIAESQKICKNINYSFLLGELTELVTVMAEEIKSALKSENQRDLRIIEMSESLVIAHEKNNDTKTILQVGFPFSLISKEINPLAKGTLKICLKGEKIRSYQREIIKSLAGLELLEQHQFEEMTKAICRSKKIANYICPYTFRGDVYISEFFVNHFKDKFELSIKNKFSVLYKDIGNEYKSYDIKTLRRSIAPGEIILLPDLIDVHFEKSIQVIQAFYKTNPIFFIGRNIIFNNKAYHLNEADFLLTDRNIDLYMKKLLTPFLGNFRLNTTHIKDFKLDKVLVNFLSSQNLRCINHTIAKKLIDLLLEEKSKIYMTLGNFRNAKDIEWIKKFFSKYPKIKNKVTLLKTSTMHDLQKIVVKEKISFGFSPDTSIPHMLSSIGIPSVILINPKQFDNTALLSIISNSSVGFCRLTQPQVPILLKKGEERKAMENILKLIKKIQIDEHFSEYEYELFEKLYSFKDFFQIPIRKHSLASWKLNTPLLKLTMMKNGQIY